MRKQILALDPATYRRHAIHAEDRLWIETNCYVDVWIELLHAWGFDPVAALPFTIAIDFEEDQWTFFKYPLRDLYDAYGLDVQELALWRPLVVHLEEQIALGRPVLVELDSYHLPDTSGAAYQRQHVKSTVAAVDIDAERQLLGYFHNQSYFQLHGDDYVHALRVNEPLGGAMLPPYAEFVKRRVAAPASGNDLTRVSLRLLKQQIALLPESNPFVRFQARFQADLAWLAGESLDTFHLYSFATWRQFGACYELAATYLNWLGQRIDAPLAEPTAAFQQIATSARTLQFNLARAMARKKPLDMGPLAQMADCWNEATTCLKRLFA